MKKPFVFTLIMVCVCLSLSAQGFEFMDGKEFLTHPGGATRVTLSDMSSL